MRPALSPAGIALSVKPSAQAWRCVELLVDGPYGLLRTWFDEAAVPALQVDATPTADVDDQWLRRGAWRAAGVRPPRVSSPRRPFTRRSVAA